MHVLLVLQERAVQRRNQHFLIAAAQRFRRNVFREQELQPIEQLGSRWLLLETGHFAEREEDLKRLLQQRFFESRKMHVDDARHRLLIGKADVVEKTAAQKRVGQFLFVVAGDDDERPMLRLYGPLRFVDIELHS